MLSVQHLFIVISESALSWHLYDAHFTFPKNFIFLAVKLISLNITLNLSLHAIISKNIQECIYMQFTIKKKTEYTAVDTL